jgi:hypothetical protein
MQKIAIGILALLALFFAADNTRLVGRQRRLEERIAGLEKEARSAPARRPAPETAPAPTPVAAAASPATPAPAATPAASSNVLEKAQLYLSRTLEDVDNAVTRVMFRKWVTILKPKSSSEELGLSEPQKSAVDGLRKSRDQQTQVYRDQIQRIEEETELAIRQLLDAEQQKKYDAQNGKVGAYADLGGFQILAQQDAPVPATNSGYLGIQASDAEGGGAKITEVLADSAAKLFGLQAGDVVLEFDQQKIEGFSRLVEQINSRSPGSYVTLRINRGGAVFNQGVELGARPK